MSLFVPESVLEPRLSLARRDLDDVWHESSVNGSDLDDYLSDHVHRLIEDLDERIAQTVATTLPGLVGQVVRLAEHNGGIGCDMDRSYFASLGATINAGIERLGRPVG
jgi:hypothetical protein